MNDVILKERLFHSGYRFETFSTLTGALISEGLSDERIYNAARYRLSKKKPFVYGNVVFHKVKFNHQKNHGKRKR